MGGAARELLRGIVDYAGLFPPAALSMRSAVENYASYRRGADAWALGRFIVPAARLHELAAAILVLDGAEGNTGGWRVSALLVADSSEDLERVRVFNEGSDVARRAIAVDALEMKGAGEEQIHRAVERVAPAFETYVELALETEAPSEEAEVGRQRGSGGISGGDAVASLEAFSPDFLQLIRDAGGRAKVRTGGVSAEMFPRPEALLRFLQACNEAGVPFKATAGLHHPVTGRYPLTYEKDSGSATMYGYLNLLLATALVRRGAADSVVLEALREGDATCFRLDAEGVAWREHRFGLEEVRRLRESSLVAFGSCSFREPMDELALVAPGIPSEGAPEP